MHTRRNGYGGEIKTIIYAMEDWKLRDQEPDRYDIHGWYRFVWMDGEEPF